MEEMPMARIRDVLLGGVFCLFLLVAFGAIPAPWQNEPAQPPTTVSAFSPARTGDAVREGNRPRILQREEVAIREVQMDHDTGPKEMY